MRIIKLGFISLVFLFSIITLFSLLIPSHVRISRAIDFTEGGDKVLSLVADKDKWPLWHPAYEPTNDSLQAQWQQQTNWKKRIQNDSLIVVELLSKNKKPIINGWQLYRHANTNTLTLQWYMDFQLSWYPWQKFSSLFFEPTYGTMMEKGLSNLKAKAEMR